MDIRRKVLDVLGVGDYIRQLIPTSDTVASKCSSRNDALNLAWYLGDKALLEKLYTQEITGRYFWRLASKAHIPVIHSPLPQTIIDTLASLTIYDVLYTDPEVDIDAVQKMLLGAFICGRAALLGTVADDGSVSYSTYFGSSAQRKADGTYSLAETVLLDGKPIVLIASVGGGYVKYSFAADSKGNAVYKDGSRCNKSPETLGYIDIKYTGEPPVIYAELPSELLSDNSLGLLAPRAEIFDGIDEVQTQLRDAIRRLRPRTYIPQKQVPVDKDGLPKVLDDLDSEYIMTQDDYSEGMENNKIQVFNEAVNSDSFIKTIDALTQQAIMGLLSPSTLGFGASTNASGASLREREKITALTRKRLLSETVEPAIKTFVVLDTYLKTGVLNENVRVEFGEMSSQSFEDAVKTTVQGLAGGVMSIETAIATLYGNSWSDADKADEVERIKAIKAQNNGTL